MVYVQIYFMIHIYRMKLYKNGIRKNIGSQSEIPRISIKHDNITISGYQSFIIYDNKTR